MKALLLYCALTPTVVDCGSIYLDEGYGDRQSCIDIVRDVYFADHTPAYEGLKRFIIGQHASPYVHMTSLCVHTSDQRLFDVQNRYRSVVMHKQGLLPQEPRWHGPYAMDFGYLHQLGNQ